ncbi:DUF2851 family protein [Tenacibaculum sp. 190524A05c]|uniref:DUF2851 family protein n=1 Tax=Tenacibaculum platacis TaxID=3137852 RepID=A0ABM9P4E3_9FLAO
MKEKFLHYVWQYKLLHQPKLYSAQNEKITIINCGVYNTNSGPDFLNAKIQIDNQLWYGNIEIHIKSSDWYTHKHETDSNYDAVILHVVWENDAEVFMKNNKPIPTLELNDKVDGNILKNYQSLVYQNSNWIPCGKQISKVNSFTLENWLERLFFERLEQKSKFILELLSETNNDYEAVLFQMLAKNFGLKVNSEAFLKLSKSFSFSVLRKVRHKEVEISALLFGQGGFLKDDVDIFFYKNLKNEYKYLKHKYLLKPLKKEYFQFFRMRPSNFPTIRIAQLSALYCKHQNLFAEVLKSENIEFLYDLFDIKVHPFWKSHYTFKKESKKSSKKLSKSFIDLVIINTIIPLKYVYFKSKGILKEEELLSLMKSLKPERNSIITNFENLKVKCDNSYASQSLLQLKNRYCDAKRCLECAIGDQLVKAQ